MKIHVIYGHRIYAVYDGGISEDKMRKKEKEKNIRENVYDLVLSMQIMT